MTLTLDGRDLVQAAYAVSAAAAEAHEDGRITQAIDWHKLAAKVWEAVGNPDEALRHAYAALELKFSGKPAAIVED